MISNAKPSAIFKISKAKGVASDDEQKISHRFNQQMLQCQIPKVKQRYACQSKWKQLSMLAFQTTAQVGISVEPLSLLQGLQQASTESEATLVPKFVDFTQKMVQSLFNFTASYAIGKTDYKHFWVGPSKRIFSYRSKRGSNERDRNFRALFCNSKLVHKLWATNQVGSVFLAEMIWIIKRTQLIGRKKKNEITTSVLTCITVQFLSLCVAFFNLQSVLNDMVAAFSYLHPKKIEVLCIMVLHELV